MLWRAKSPILSKHGMRGARFKVGMMPELREVRLSRQDRKVLEACCRSPMTFSDLKRARIVLLAKAGSRPQTGVHMRTGRSSASTPDLETSHASSLCLVFEPGSGSDRCLARLLLDHLFVQAPQLATVSDLAKRFVSLLSGSDIAELDEKQALGSVFKARHTSPTPPTDHNVSRAPGARPCHLIQLQYEIIIHSCICYGLGLCFNAVK
ncbi:hypothetical protein ACVWZM_004782 [Bradyrhizobium sp. USDA 4501]